MIVCVGSLNQDLAVRLPHLPAPDETLLAHSAAKFRGGKGQNQALAAARLGAPVTMVGCVGDDDAGRWLRAGLTTESVDTSYLQTAEDHETGTALCLLDETGEVAIVVVAGANAAVDRNLVEAAADVLGEASVVLLQGEIAVDASLRAAALGGAAGAWVVVNPAPVPPDAGALVEAADLLVVNRPEAETLASSIRRLPPERVVVTKGADGVTVAGEHIPAYPATVADPTGAGDAFVGALAVALHEGAELVEAARFGAAAGACAVEVDGAEPSLPTRSQVETRLR